MGSGRCRRIVTLVLVDGTGAVVRALPPFELPAPWWQEASDVVAGARERYGVDVTVLRLLAAGRPVPHGGAVTYLAECPTGAPGPAVPVDPAAFDPGRSTWRRIR